jgi:aminoglycoside phosphotransferase (APT) family kinase protein
MAGTPSPRSETPCRSALARFLARASGAQAVAITALDRLRGGAIQHNWGIDARFSGGALAGEQRLVLRAAGPARFSESLPPQAEFAVLRAAFVAGVRVPEPLFAGTDGAVCGRPFLVMRRVAGSAAPGPITGGCALPEVAEDLGRQLARLHRIRPPRHDLADLPAYHDPVVRIAQLRAALDRRPHPRPVLEWGLHWLEAHLPPPAAPVLCHRDFRTGNYLLAAAGAKMALAAILDWEFAGWGDPHEDIGWFCCKAWRFARHERAGGGIADRSAFYRGYEDEADRRIDPHRVHFWEVLANVRWAVIALQQGDRYMLGGERDLDLALTGRRASESELEILMLLDPALSPRVPPAPGEEPVHDGTAGPRDAPEGPGRARLLALARAVLNEELTPLLPRDRQDDARLVAAALAVAEREAAAPDEPFAAILRALAAFYGGCAYLPGSGDAGAALLLRRFAGDLRRGAFEASPQRERAACTLMRDLTIARLRIENPDFLAANGFL